MKLLKDLKTSEQEIETLKLYTIELKTRVAVYIPVKDDPVDKLLADFINNYPDRAKLKIMFQRQSQGVYSFGKKKVNISIQNGNQIKIRVGGGY